MPELPLRTCLKCSCKFLPLHRYNFLCHKCGQANAKDTIRKQAPHAHTHKKGDMAE